MPETTTPTYAHFWFARLRPTWYRLSGTERSQHLAGVDALASRYPEVRVDHYLPEVSEPRCDFLLRLEAEDPRALGEVAAWLEAGSFFQHVETVLAARGKTLPPRYVSPEQVQELLRRAPGPDLPRHAFLFRIRRSRAWWLLPEPERRAMVREHVERGLAAGEPIDRCCYYCEGLDDQQDFLYYVESYSPAAVLEAYEAARSLRDAAYWARHDLAFRGRRVTPAEWEDRVRLGWAGDPRFPAYPPGPLPGPEVPPPGPELRP